MRRSLPIPLIICASALLVGAVHAAPAWSRAANLDFWNVGDDWANLHSDADKLAALEVQNDILRQRITASMGIASAYCEAHSTLAEAVDNVLALAAASPEWFSTLRQATHVPASITNREVATLYLRERIAYLSHVAEVEGDVSRAAFVAARLVEFDKELLCQESHVAPIATGH